MSTNDRDTKFAGFAKLLQDELNDAWEHYMHNLASISSEEYFQEIHQIIARRAYDLIEHVQSQFPIAFHPGGVRGIISSVADMQQWPEHERFATALADLAKIHEKIHRMPPQQG